MGKITTHSEKLTEHQKHVADCYIKAERDITKTVKLAGMVDYKDPEQAVRAILRRAHVKAYLLGEDVNKLADHVPDAVKTLIKLVKSAKSEKVRLEASIKLLALAGVKEKDQVQTGSSSININIGQAKDKPAADIQGQVIDSAGQSEDD